MNFNNIFLSVFCVMLAGVSYGALPVGSKNLTSKAGGHPTTAAGCAAPRAVEYMDFNNVRCVIDGTGGSMWQDRPNGRSGYEIPKRLKNSDPYRTSIFAGGLWMGGKDANGQLKLAAVKFRSGGQNDFWPGPLSENIAEIDANTCEEWDRYYRISRAQVNQFVDWYNCKIDPLCDLSQPPYAGYQIPEEILDWPAKGNTALGQAENLAPYVDVNGDNAYNPEDGDYPKYDLKGDVDCRKERDVRLYGDETLWWIFNDKGNAHTESGAPSIGMEIHAQAFAFATNDEINNMTFYNYELINRSTFTLQNTYFGQYVDADLGFSNDDYVGCDAERGLGYCYNGDNYDEDGNSIIGYGSQPPAVGIDFFEGPYPDNDGIDNPLTQNIQDAIDSNGIPYPGLGLGYGDGVVDNERYGMKKFVYYNNAGSGPQSDPDKAAEFYNYLSGFWKNGSPFYWGGVGFNGTPGVTTQQCDLMFPGNSDPLNWSTAGTAISPTDWTEQQAGNPPGDRRFLQSAGPFTLKPGAHNDITVGVVWAQAAGGGSFASVEALRLADDKAQALFDACFKIANGPDAPDLEIQEVDNELIMYLSNRKISNNYNEEYREVNPFVVIPDTLDGVAIPDADKNQYKEYVFQGYQVFQVKNSTVSNADLLDSDKARLVFQSDIKDGVTQLVNFEFDDNLNASIPVEMVNGEDKGIRHSFKVSKDMFATGSSDLLVNFKTYYYIAIAYGYNEYKRYDQSNPLALDGQKVPYIASRKLAGGGSISPISAIPHNPVAENNGTMSNVSYGDGVKVTRLEGVGNGANDLMLTEESEEFIVSNTFMDFPVYVPNHGPISVKVIDPLMVKEGKFKVVFQDTTPGDLSDAIWFLKDETNTIIASSERTIEVANEQLIPELGLSITVQQAGMPGENSELGNGFITSRITYDDPGKAWLKPVADQDGPEDQNWIRSGTTEFDTEAQYNDYKTLDDNQFYEGVIDGGFSPYRLVSYRQPATNVVHTPGYSAGSGLSVKLSKLSDTKSVDIVFTSDKSKWSRSVVLESSGEESLAAGNTKHLNLRSDNSVDKEGNIDGTGTGMGWFPGYAIDLETGERLNIGFAEDSWLAGDRGRDMQWNPSSRESTVIADFSNPAGFVDVPVWGGKHFIYVFGHNNGYPAYDGCAQIYSKMSTGSTIEIRNTMLTCMWVGNMMLEEGASVLATDARVSLRVERAYENFATASTENASLPMYQFEVSDEATVTNSSLAMDSTLALINVVPNPYYAFSSYETNQLDNRIKITNIPEECTISIYNVGGTLIRRFQKADPSTSIDWDLKNSSKIPVASGVYLIHVEVPNVGERVLKWFGVMKPVDLNTF